MSIADSLKATAEAAMNMTGFVYDQQSGLYYDYSTGYYYNAVSDIIIKIFLSSRGYNKNSITRYVSLGILFSKMK